MTIATTDSTSREVAVRTTNGLSIADDQTWWTDRQLAGLQQIGVDKASQGDLLVFMHVAQRTGLDPFARQIYMIGRWDNRTKSMKQTIQTGIDGYRLVADRADRRDGTTRSYEDTLWADAEGTWTDLWTKATAPTAAKVTVLRDGRRFSAVAMYREYVQTNKDNQPNPMWARMPANQLAKCAEALALRKAYPQDLSGLYTDDEMGQADRAPREVGATGGTAAERLGAALRDTAPTTVEADGHQVDAATGEVHDPPADAPASEPDQEPAAGGQTLDMRSQLARRMFASLNDAGIDDDDQHEWLSNVLARDIRSRKDLTPRDAMTVIDHLEQQAGGA